MAADEFWIKVSGEEKLDVGYRKDCVMLFGAITGELQVPVALNVCSCMMTCSLRTGLSWSSCARGLCERSHLLSLLCEVI